MGDSIGPGMNDFQADGEWGAGDLGCGPLVLELRKRLQAMPGRLLKVKALDPAAPFDLPAWCRLTDNELVRHDTETKHFWINVAGDMVLKGKGQPL